MMAILKDQIAGFLFAVQFLTRIPISPQITFTEMRDRLAPGYYPAVGVMIGLLGAIVWWLATEPFGHPLAVVLSMVFTIALTGAFHEDGLADTFDSFGANDTQRALEIMRDSRLGTYGVCALGCVLLVKGLSLMQVPASLVFYLFIASHSLSRFSSMMVARSSTYVRDTGIAKPVAQEIPPTPMRVMLITVGLVIIAGVIFLPLSFVLFLLGAMVIGHFVSRLCYERRLGGYTGDCLGATQQITEVSMYLAAVLWL